MSTIENKVRIVGSLCKYSYFHIDKSIALSPTDTCTAVQKPQNVGGQATGSDHLEILLIEGQVIELLLYIENSFYIAWLKFNTYRI